MVSRKNTFFLTSIVLAVAMAIFLVSKFFDSVKDSPQASGNNSPTATASSQEPVITSPSPSHDMYAAPPYPVKSVNNNGQEGWTTKQRVGYSLAEVPEQYRDAVTIPEFNPDNLKGSPYANSWKQGQCTELTWAYLNQLWSKKLHSTKNGGVLYQGYGEAGGYVTDNPTVGYGYSVPAEIVGDKFGHTGVVIAVYPDGSFLTANYNME
ncbi:MAG: CHAP domain-containing protein, partial [Micrococcaceae bacterium]